MLMSERIESIREIRRQYPSNWMKPYFNKLEGKEFAAKYGVYGPKVLREFESIDDLPELTDLPGRFVLKPVDGNGNRGVFCVSDGFDYMNNAPITRDEILEKVKNNDVVGKSRFIIEEFIQDYSGDPGLPKDFKFYNFGDRCAFIHVVKRMDPKDSKKNFHWFIDEHRNKFKHQFIKTQKHSDVELEYPDHFDDMVALSKKLASKIGAFVRVDLYATKDTAIFGEFTAFPHGGKGYMKDADEYLGRMWKGTYGASQMDFIKHARVKYLGH